MATTQPANASVDAIPPPSSLNQSSDSSPSSSNSSATTDPPKDSAPNQPSKLPAPSTSSNTSASLPPSSPPPSPPPASPPPVPTSPPPPILSQSPPLEVVNPKSSSPSPSIVVPSPLSPSEKTSPPSADTPLPPAKQLENSPPPSALTPPSPPVSSPSSLPPTSSLIPGPTTSPSNGSINYSAGGAPLSFNLSLPVGVPPGKPTSSGSSISTNAAPAESGGIKAGTAVALGIALGFLGLGLVIVAVWFARKQKRRGADSSFLNAQYSAHPDRCTSGSDIKDSPISALGNSRSWFTYEELARATNGFSAENILGEGGFGCVYKGLLVDGKEVAVKQLKIGAGQGEREFRAEVEIISHIHHRHLVSLVGYCISENERLLVYDYVPNNTLDYHLHADGRPVIKWATRVKVAAGAARGIAYLHEDCNPRIIHRDIKSSNILLDNNFTAQVADFGLAKLAADANSHVTTRVVGTFGYLAPEYASSGKLTEKSDVFSFGVVLLELITGRKPVDASQPEGAESLVEWARPLLTRALESERFQELIDPRLENNYVKDEMLTMIEAAAACTRHLASKRPQMSQLVRVLGSAGEPDLSNGIKPGQSTDLDSKEQYAEIRMFQRMAFGNQDFSLDLSDGSQSSGDCSK